MITSVKPSVIDEQLVARYPVNHQLYDGTNLTLTPLVPSDWQLLANFLEEVLQQDRLFLRQDVVAIVERWCADLNYQHNLPLLVWDGGRIVADATLHQEPGLWTSHIGKMRLFVHPDYRRRGVGTAIVAHLLEIAGELGLHKLVCECAAQQGVLRALLTRCGFRDVACLREFIRDHRGDLHDMLLFVHSVN